MRLVALFIALFASVVCAQNPRPRASIGPDQSPTGAGVSMNPASVTTGGIDAGTIMTGAIRTTVVDDSGMCWPLFGDTYSMSWGSTNTAQMSLYTFVGLGCTGAASQTPLSYAVVSGEWSTPTSFNASQFRVGGIAVVVGSTPTISSGFGTSPSVTAGKAYAFRVNVGTGGTANSGVIALGTTATTGWNCNCADLTTQSSTVFLCKQTAGSTTTATIGNFNTSGAAAAWVASDIVAVSCTAF